MQKQNKLEFGIVELRQSVFEKIQTSVAQRPSCRGFANRYIIEAHAPTYPVLCRIVRKVQLSHFVSIYFPRLSNEYCNNWDTTKYRSESLISCRPLSYTISLYAYLIELRVSLSHYCNRLHYFNIGRYRLIFHGRTRAQSQLPAHSPFQSPATPLLPTPAQTSTLPQRRMHGLGLSVYLEIEGDMMGWGQRVLRMGSSLALLASFTCDSPPLRAPQGRVGPRVVPIHRGRCRGLVSLA